jgi:hypothetical protein
MYVILELSYYCIHGRHIFSGGPGVSHFRGGGGDWLTPFLMAIFFQKKKKKNLPKNKINK